MRIPFKHGGALALLAMCMQPALAQPAAEPARVMTTSTLAGLCGLPATNPDQPAAQAFCRGFIIGAGQYHNEVSQARGARPIFCLPTPSPSLEAGQASFVGWAAANPQYGDDKAVNSVMRWAATTYPCPPAAPARRATSR
ncbi:Rap1a/Tai family immunity protein [Humitalea sp. 24SJ18S-53]|uniref:Rap1a/Tai family immunity protein n=1 Tax=Humitalea sp. 24SJ18S-53 TaxID=3422307 RepID=UPI003D6651F2